MTVEHLFRWAGRIGARRRWLLAIGVLGVVVSLGLMVVTRDAGQLGAIVFVPWVAIIGVELGPGWGGLAGLVSVAVYFAAAVTVGGPDGPVALTSRSVALIFVGLGSGLAARRIAADAEKLRGQAALQRALIDSTLDGICFTDLDGNIILLNTPLREMAVELGVPASGTVSERLLAVADRTTEPARYRERMAALAANLEPSEDEFEFADSGRVFRGYTARVREPEGAPLGRIWTLREVTADRRLDRLREAFIAGVSHELRTPLTSISGFAQLLADEEESLSSQGREYLGVIGRATRRLRALVEDILLVAQIEASGFAVRLGPADLSQLAAAAVAAARPTAEEKNVALVLHADGPLPVEADPERLGQVLDNLLSNAVKFTPAGGSVLVVVHNGDGRAVVEITDTGIGVPRDEIGRLFSRFYRASTATSRAIPGTGLGLVIAKAIVDAHGGSIALDSSEGDGTSVTVSLPAG